MKNGEKQQIYISFLLQRAEVESGPMGHGCLPDSNTSPPHRQKSFKNDGLNKKRACSANPVSLAGPEPAFYFY
jgi:hypothetical protein